jgi:UMF1 family MFS transporter
MAMNLKDLSDSDRKSIKSWYYYDWANSAHSTSVMVAIAPVYFVSLYENIFGINGYSLSGFTLTADNLWSIAISLSTLIVSFASPILAVIADKTPTKLLFLKIFTIIGCIATFLMFFTPYVGTGWLFLLISITISVIGFAGAWTFANSFLPHLAPKKYLDEISSKGFAYGYIGGGLLLAIHLVIITIIPEYISGIDELLIQLSLASVGLWWFGFSLITFKNLKEPKISATEKIQFNINIVGIAFTQLKSTLSDIGRYKMLFMYLVIYLLFNDGIQTVLSIAGAYGAATLGVDLVFNMATILIVQLIAAPGALFFNKLAIIYSSKKALMISLIGWIIIVILAMGFAPLEDTGDYAIKSGIFSWWPEFIRSIIWLPLGLSVNYQWLILGCMVGIVMGGSQAIARSIFAVMTPVKQSAEFFSFLGFMSRGATVFGPLLYALVAGYFGARTGIFSVLIFLVAGTIGMQLFIDVNKGIKQATSNVRK